MPALQLISPELLMHKELAAWQFILTSLHQTTPVMLLYVLESSGSSPGRQGFLMAVTAAGQISGSLGGGIMEYKFVELAKRKLQEPANNKTSVHRQVHNKAALQNQSGMICSGEQTIFMYQVQREDAATVSTLVKSLESHKNGTLQIDNTGISFFDKVPPENFSLKKTADNFLLTEKTGYKQHLCIIGAGHCSLAFARLMSTMDFYIKLYDNRPAINTLEQNVFVHEKIHLEDYAELGNLVVSGSDTYIVVMTNGYRDDDKAIRAVINKRFAYIGLLGSKKKIEKMFTTYQEEGIDMHLLKSIYAPAGVYIKSQTPEEIAVSIAAEIISVKNNKLAG